MRRIQRFPEYHHWLGRGRQRPRSEEESLTWMSQSRRFLNSVDFTERYSVSLFVVPRLCGTRLKFWATLSGKGRQCVSADSSSEFSDRRELKKIIPVVDKNANFDERKINKLWRESTINLGPSSGEQVLYARRFEIDLTKI